MAMEQTTYVILRSEIHVNANGKSEIVEMSTLKRKDLTFLFSQTARQAHSSNTYIYSIISGNFKINKLNFFVKHSNIA